MTRAIEPGEVLAEPSAKDEQAEDKLMHELITLALDRTWSPGLALRAIVMAAGGLAAEADDPQAALLACCELLGEWLDEVRPVGDPNWLRDVRARLGLLGRPS